MENDDKDLEKIIREIDEGVSRHAPPFEAVWNAAQERKLQHGKKRRFQWLAMAASLAILTVCIFLIYNHSDRISRIGKTQPLSEWRSPTDVLLDYPSSFSLHVIKSSPTDALLRVGKLDITDGQEDS
ncbi:MAG: hypothetical protein HKN87_21050 [Saprospiraceae bacterium]|nr:hypothetical protein [Saprospiraceae bacterium]